jgi:protoporphyrinogen oxidase
MVPDPGTACYGLEYFCTVGDELWTRPDAELVELAATELESLHLVSRRDVLDGTVVRQAKAYPVYDQGYSGNVEIVRRHLEQSHPTLHLVGRNGMHKYNNQDHAMMTAMLTAENIIAGSHLHDPWRVNEDAEYHEESAESPRSESGLRAVPQPLTE